MGRGMGECMCEWVCVGGCVSGCVWVDVNLGGWAGMSVCTLM